MGPEMKLFVEVASKIFETPTPICEVGSFQVPEGFANLRPYFPKPYIGLDMRHGPGVNVNGSVELLPLKNESIGTLISVATMEHVENPIRAFNEIYRGASTGGGIVILTSVFNQNILYKVKCNHTNFLNILFIRVASIPAFFSIARIISTSSLSKLPVKSSKRPYTNKKRNRRKGSIQNSTLR